MALQSFQKMIVYLRSLLSLENRGQFNTNESATREWILALNVRHTEWVLLFLFCEKTYHKFAAALY